MSVAEPEVPAPDAPPDAETESRASERLIFFSDAVVAIAMTLLALDLPVPAGHTASQFLHSVSSNYAQYLAFLVSFLTISGAWGNHHDIFRYVRRADGRLRALDMTWLMLIVLIPFATRLLTSTGEDSLTVNAFQFGFYALIQTLDSALMLAMLWHMSGAGLAPDLPAKTFQSVTRLEITLMAGFGLSIPVFFVTPFGWVLWFVLPAGHRWWLRFLRAGRKVEAIRATRKPAPSRDDADQDGPG